MKPRTESARRLFAMILFAALGAGGACLAAGCGSDDDTTDGDPDCVAGAVCSCADCSKPCGGNGSSCAFECTGGTCSFSCPGGSCTAEATGAAALSLDCPGGSCTVSCANTPSCTLTGCTTACTMNCGGAATCDSSCDAPLCTVAP